MKIKTEATYYGKMIKIEINDIIFWMSNGECIAFETLEDDLVISQNVWGNSTGMHLNWLDRNKKIRIPRDHFEHILSELNV